MKELEIVGNKTICPVIAFINGNKLLVGLRNYYQGKEKTVSVWTIPGGRCDEGETVGVTLKREVVEEVGITDFKVNKFLGKVPGAKAGDIVYTFMGETCQMPKLAEPEKFSEWTWMDLNEIPENFVNEKVLNLVKKEQIQRTI